MSITNYVAGTAPHPDLVPNLDSQQPSLTTLCSMPAQYDVSMHYAQTDTTAMQQPLNLHIACPAVTIIDSHQPINWSQCNQPPVTCQPNVQQQSLPQQQNQTSNTVHDVQNQSEITAPSNGGKSLGANNNDNNNNSTAAATTTTTMSTSKRRRFSSDQLKCRFCPKKCSDAGQLVDHETDCQTARAFECATCHKRFKTRTGLAQHQRIHLQQRPYACAYCDKSFTQKSHVDQHERIHTGVKPFDCQFCGRTFRQRSQQQSHELSHLKG